MSERAAGWIDAAGRAVSDGLQAFGEGLSCGVEGVGEDIRATVVDIAIAMVEALRS